ncbi:leucine-rich repeat and calponin homology domain-containing protein isoform X2 [Phymastichus coffea]|uniref:leucine-rich repeat and calponin homology domain-containing protein isoform X2 n=1 Tax=Phymastichus coffea TaxID=108790 RepID=UPI00273AECE9|nr:leucine-rich repeat and calponin homology domain-containing protein isoform X2 [Phymastichus coffea]
MALAAVVNGSNNNMNGHIHKQLTRSLERTLEEAQLSGELKLSGRKLKDFPKVGKPTAGIKYNLQDTVFADLSKNRFLELPEEVTELKFLEKLYLYHNAIRIIPESVSMLQSLTYLDLSRNQLTTLPREVCRLPLQTLLVAYNRLEALPDELGRMTVLAELDAGCNEITNLPSRMGDLSQLRCLDLRCNLLVQIPIELTYLKLITFDISGNRISVLPNELRKMKSLVDFKLSNNPLTSPPAALCVRGRTHIFKYLERQAVKHERARNGRAKRGQLEPRSHATLDMRSQRRHNVDSGYNTSDGFDKRWSQDVNSAGHDDGTCSTWCKESSPLSITLPYEVTMNGPYSDILAHRVISPGENTSISDDLRKAIIFQEQLEKKKLELSLENGEDLQKSSFVTQKTSISNTEKPLLGSSQKNSLAQIISPIETTNTLSHVDGDKKQSLGHIQTYREYKEALRQQRANESSRIYRAKEQVPLPESNWFIESTDLSENNVSIDQQTFIEDNSNKRPVQKVVPSRVNYQNSTLLTVSPELNNKNRKYHELIYKKPGSPIKTPSSFVPQISNPGHIPRSTKTQIYVLQDNKKSPNKGPNSSSTGFWNTNFSSKYSFTMKREFERAKEEAELIEQLRNQIESRLKMALPEDLASALTDGVVLCHLANHVRPRSVASIHVPSPAVPKLTMARCRRNVDNFLEACRKIGVDENLLCCTSDVLEAGRGIVRIAVTVAELLRFHQTRTPLHTQESGTTFSNHVST